MLIEIKNRFNGEVLFSHDVENNTIAITVGAALTVDADLSFADLRFANLSFANLRFANLRSADLRFANLRSANLSFANLRSADLRFANLSSANLRSANLRGEVLEKSPMLINELHWLVTITTKFLTIGCQYHTHETWANFTEQEIADMDSYAPEFWSVWKTPLLAMCAAHKK